MNDLHVVKELDRELVGAAKGIKVLSRLAWDADVQRTFLEQWRRGKPALPVVAYAPVNLSQHLTQLDAIVNRSAALDHPLARFVHDTARSYLDGGRMLEHLGKPDMSAISVAIYGRPGDVLTGGQGTTSLDAAQYFLSVADEFYRNNLLRESELCLPAATVKAAIEKGLTEVFDGGQVKVVVDKHMVAKAAAGATCIRLRDATCFSEYDAEQLLQHEAFVHSLTALNGRRQSTLSAFSLGAPRTTAAQEGLATFAELVTGSIDISRLERVAMRIIAIDKALNGADFIDVFRYFIEAGQPETESFSSSMRVFRGAPLKGGYAFAKDAVYLRGLLEVHTFFRWAFKEQKFFLCENFFAGRMTLGDVERYAAFFGDGTVSAPTYLPPWMTRTTGLAGYLAFSVFANAIDLSAIYAAHEFDGIGPGNGTIDG